MLHTIKDLITSDAFKYNIIWHDVSINLILSFPILVSEHTVVFFYIYVYITFLVQGNIMYNNFINRTTKHFNVNFIKNIVNQYLINLKQNKVMVIIVCILMITVKYFIIKGLNIGTNDIIIY